MNECFEVRCPQCDQRASVWEKSGEATKGKLCPTCHLIMERVGTAVAPAFPAAPMQVEEVWYEISELQVEEGDEGLIGDTWCSIYSDGGGVLRFSPSNGSVSKVPIENLRDLGIKYRSRTKRVDHKFVARVHSCDQQNGLVTICWPVAFSYPKRDQLIRIELSQPEKKHA